MKKADASGAEYAVIVGETELAREAAAVKALRASDPGAAFAQQRIVPLDELPEALVDALMQAEQAQERQET
jgi:histidyl-tRNA synthetase